MPCAKTISENTKYTVSSTSSYKSNRKLRYYTWQVYIICNTKWFTSINELIAPLPRVVKCVFRPPVIYLPYDVYIIVLLSTKCSNIFKTYCIMSEKWEKNSLYISFWVSYDRLTNELSTASLLVHFSFRFGSCQTTFGERW